MTTRTDRPVLYIAETAHHTMSVAAKKSHPNETGGILVGVHLNGQPWVTAVIEIASTDRGHTHYKLPAGSTQPAVRRARQTDTRLGYLGDWHTHPDNVGPSPTDLTTLGLISLRHPRTPNPTLIVVRKAISNYELDARRVGTVTPRTCEIQYTGDLPISAPTFDPTPASDEPGGQEHT